MLNLTSQSKIIEVHQQELAKSNQQRSEMKTVLECKQILSVDCQNVMYEMNSMKADLITVNTKISDLDRFLNYFHLKYWHSELDAFNHFIDCSSSHLIYHELNINLF